VVAEVAALGPQRVHQPVVERLVQATVACQLGQAQGRPGVRDRLRYVEVELVSREELAQEVVVVRAVAASQLVARNSPGRVLRVEVEGEPGDSGAVPVPQPLGQSLADAAERSDVVAPDEDFGCAFGHGSSRESRSSIVWRRRIRRASPSATSTAAGCGTTL
jgi:hypothetical protein